MKLKISAITAALLFLGACATSDHYVKFNSVKPAGRQVVLSSTHNPILDSPMPGSRVIMEAVTSETLKGYGTPFVLVVVNRGKKPISISASDIRFTQSGMSPSLVDGARVIDIDSKYTSSNFNLSMVSAVAAGLMLGAAKTPDPTAAQQVAKPIAAISEDSEKLVKQRSADFDATQFPFGSLKPGAVASGFIVVENLNKAPLTIRVQLGSDIHELTFAKRD